MFRDDRSRSLINRMGFNNDGSEAVAERIRHHIRRKGPCLVLCWRTSGNQNHAKRRGLVDYATSMERLHDVVDGFVVNVSSPNTPNLRDLQHEEALKGLLEGLALRLTLEQRSLHPRPMLVKFAPDLAEDALLRMVDVARAAGADGVVLTNTTVQRDAPTHPAQAEFLAEAGGLSELRSKTAARR